MGLVQGAKDAGLSPLAALGVSAPGATVSLGGDDSSGWSEAVSEIGQGVSRAASAYQPREVRKLQKAKAALDLENGHLQNARLRAEIRLMETSATKAMSAITPIPGQSVSLPAESDVITIPKEIVANTGSTEKGVSPGLQYFDIGLGLPIRARSEPMTEATEDSWVLPGLLDLGYSLPDIIKAALYTNWDSQPAYGAGLSGRSSSRRRGRESFNVY